MVDAAHLRQDLDRADAGTVIGPEHDGFDDARRSFNGLVDRRPLLIVQPVDATGVATTVAIALDHDLPIAVRGGGHSVAGHPFADGAVTIDLRRMRGVDVDPVRRVARVQGGALWEDVDTATTAHGLAMPGGTFVDTGVGGLALGGGIGWLLGVGGLTCDRLIRAEVVTGRGERVVASVDDDAELLWALKGGGGNFGVVTAFEFSLLEVGPMVGGYMSWPIEAGRELLARVDAAIAELPDELAVFPVIGADDRTPEEPALVVSLGMAWVGEDEAEARRAMAPFLVPGAIADEFHPCSYLDLQRLNGIMEFGLRNYWTGHFLPGLPADAIDGMIEAMASRPNPTDFILLEALSGLASRIPESSAAFGGRAARWNASALSIWNDPAFDEAEIGWARSTSTLIGQHSLQGGGYVNYSPPDEPAERVRAAYGDDRFARLQAVKRRHDPHNRFCFNHNIPPA